LILGISGSGRADGTTSDVVKYIKRVMDSNQMAVLDTFQVEGYSQCFSCGYGIDCAAGTVVDRHGFLDKIAKTLGSILEERKN